MIFFPEVQLSPFFALHEKQDATPWLLRPDGAEVHALCDTCRRLKLFASPNVYLELDGKPYDASLFIDDNGEIQGISKMVHIYQAENFYERDYYTPAPDGFKVYDTPFGKIGIVICFDRHIPTSIRACAQQGAELILIPTANLTCEPLELFEWEFRVQAFQNVSYVAMCNRVGPEEALTFAGQSLAAAPDGSLLYRAADSAGLYCTEIPLEQVKAARSARSWLQFR